NLITIQKKKKSKFLLPFTTNNDFLTLSILKELTTHGTQNIQRTFSMCQQLCSQHHGRKVDGTLGQWEI
ncbi:MAG: hypothetical protein Q8L73_03400, partial [Methylotenera sp.]|nr:hypothetical protein [Methylotenera sp.]